MQEILTKNIIFFYMSLNLLCLIELICKYFVFVFFNVRSLRFESVCDEMSFIEILNKINLDSTG